MWILTLLLASAAWAQDALAPAERLIAEGRYQPALDTLQQGSAHTARWHLLASKAYEGTNDLARAVDEAEAALSLEPWSEAAHLQLGQIFLSHNTPSAAYEVFSEAQKLFPDSFLVLLGKGLALKELQRYDEAAAELRKSLARQPSSGIAFDALATVFLHSMKCESVLQISEQYVNRNPADYRGYYYLAAGREGLGLPDEVTCELLKKSIERNPDFAASHGLMGKILLRQNSIEDAVMSLERAVALRPDHIPSHMALANAYRKLGREADASREFRIVRELHERERQSRPALLFHRGTR
jgi:tetratricopeptide (TPR) repeat protein